MPVDSSEVPTRIASNKMPLVSNQRTFKQSVLFGLYVARAVLIVIIFICGAISICISQLVFNQLFRSKFNIRHGLIALTKKYFVVLTATIIHVICPTNIRVTADLSTMPKGTFSLRNNELISGLIPRSMIIANHQIYTDWAFLWWISYTADLGDSIYIMLKQSLQKIPLLGYGMQNYGFIFLSRKWEKDKITIKKALQKLVLFNGVGTTNSFSENSEEPRKPSIEAQVTVKWPYCLLLFPEGTNMSPSRREVSDKYCAKLGLPSMNNVLLPRSTGIRNCLRNLRSSCEVVYDVTIGYSGIKQDEYGEAKYTLGSMFVEGIGPEITDMYFKAIHLKDIPLGPETMSEGEDVEWTKKFDKWLYDLWYDKDKLMDTFYEHGTFTPDLKLDSSTCHAIDASHEVVLAPLKPRSLKEFLQIFMVPATLILLVRMVVKLGFSLWGYGS